MQTFIRKSERETGSYERSRIYEIGCSYCSEKYYSQGRRDIRTGYTEILVHIKYSQYQKSNMAHGVSNSELSVVKASLRLVRHVTEERPEGDYESFRII